jgi:hypothetical protein
MVLVVTFILPLHSQLAFANLVSQNRANTWVRPNFNADQVMMLVGAHHPLADEVFPHSIVPVNTHKHTSKKTDK